MKERMFIIIMVILLVSISLYFFTLYSFLNSVGSGDAFRVDIIYGCDEILSDAADGTISLSENLQNFVLVEYGIPSEGLKKSTLRDFCVEYGTQKCLEDVVRVCRSATS